LGRRWNVDPEYANAPSWSPYRSYFNNPIFFVDPNGRFEIKGSTEGKNRKDRRQNRQEIRVLKEYVRNAQNEMASWKESDWRFIKENTGMSRNEYLEMFKNGSGPVLKFTDISERSSGLMNGDNEGKSIKGDRYAEANAQEIVIDEGFYKAMQDWQKSSSSKNEEFGSLKHQRLKFSSGWSRTSYLKNEKAELVKFAVLTLGHESQHSGAAQKGLSERRFIAPFTSTQERGELFELRFYGAVKDHHDFGFGVFQAFEARPFTPGQQNRDEPFKENSRDFWDRYYGK